MLSLSDYSLTLPLDECVQIATREVTGLVEELELTLTPRQSSLLHQIRLASEALGVARATQTLRLR
jgi:hypothetical protein